jgi:hypothetical protein
MATKATTVTVVTAVNNYACKVTTVTMVTAVTKYGNQLITVTAVTKVIVMTKRTWVNLLIKLTMVNNNWKL